MTERKEARVRYIEEQMYSKEELMQMTEENSKIFVQRLVNLFEESYEDDIYSFTLSETSLQI